MKAKHFIMTLKPEIKNEFIATNIYPNYKWVDGKPTDEQEGWTIRAVCPSAQFEETIVRIDTSDPPLDIDKLESDPQQVSFDNLTFTSYYSMKIGKQVYQGHATGLKLLKQKP